LHERSPQKLKKKKPPKTEKRNGVPKAQDWRSCERELKKLKTNKSKIQKKNKYDNKNLKRNNSKKR
jgi:hypothetical protein